MAKTTTKAAANTAAFDPSELTEEQQKLVVEHFLGVHPDFFVFEGLQIKADVYKMNYAGKHWNGWKGQKLW